MFKKLITLLVVVGLLFALGTMSEGFRETMATASEPAKDLIGKTSEMTQKVGGALGDKFMPENLIPENAEIDWGDGVVKATGHGALPVASQTYPQAKLMAVGAAELDAQRILAATLRGAMITSKRKLENYIQKEYIVEENIHAMIHGAQVTDVRVMPDGNVQVDMELRLKGIEGDGTSKVAEHAPAGQDGPTPGRMQGWRAIDYYNPTADVFSCISRVCRRKSSSSADGIFYPAPFFMYPRIACVAQWLARSADGRKGVGSIPSSGFFC